MPIPGTRKLERLDENIGAVAVGLTPGDLREIESAASKITVKRGSLPGRDRANDRPLTANNSTSRTRIYMTSEDVINLYTELENLKITVWVDGGWGVDALLGVQTRPHQDLDIAVQERDVPRLRHLLMERGYRDIELEEARPWNFVLGDQNGREIDLHVIVLDDHGNGLYGPRERGEMYPGALLTGTGSINGQIVGCISPEWMVKFHSGYELKEKDFQDVSALCKKFGIGLPESFAQFKK